LKSRRITFGEQIEITGIKDEIQETINSGGQYWSNIVTAKLGQIGQISRKQANMAITELKLEKLGFRKLDLRTYKDIDKRFKNPPEPKIKKVKPQKQIVKKGDCECSPAIQYAQERRRSGQPCFYCDKMRKM